MNHSQIICLVFAFIFAIIGGAAIQDDQYSAFGLCLLFMIGGIIEDPETGYSHLYHASCCLMFASELYYGPKKLEVDDRYKTAEMPQTQKKELINENHDRN